MQTFLPYPDFEETARVLDDRRLGRQRLEGLQVARALVVPGYPWKKHPAVLMWKGYEEALESYVVAICDEWERRGFEDTCRASLRGDLDAAGVPAPSPQWLLSEEGRLPAWLGDEALHRSHRGSLLLKDREWYGRFFPSYEAQDWNGYVWPVPRPAVVPAGATRRRERVSR